VRRDASVRTALGHEASRALLRESLPGGIQRAEAFMGALGWAFARRGPRRDVVVTAIHHGRTAPFEDVDLSRTVGWLATRVPVLMRVPDGERIADVIAGLGEQLRGVPNDGASYLALCYGAPAEAGRAVGSLLEWADCTFNFLGSEGSDSPTSGFLAAAGEQINLFDNIPARPGHESIGVFGRITADGDVRFEWTYDGRLHDEATIRRLASTHLEAVGSLAAGS
jgi:hypothetical protein